MVCYLRNSRCSERKKNLVEKKLNYFDVSAMYIGAVMGAGFASGREGWQFFGVFGLKGYAGLLISGFLFVAMGMMVSYIAVELNTMDMGKIIVFTGSSRLADIVGRILAGILYLIIISMSAAGGSFLHQQFGCHQAVGGLIIIVLVILTVLGNFERISKIFKWVIPALFILDIGLCIVVIFSDVSQSGATTGFPASSLAPDCRIAAVLFTSYNMLGMIPVVAEASIKSKDRKHGILGAGLGGLILIVLTVVLVAALRKDMAFTQEMDLPMLAYSERISPLANIIFGAVLFAAIYASATTLYYGFSTKIKDTPKKKYILIIGALIGFCIGLTGFKSIVSFMYPMEGYIGLAVMAMITINFIKIYTEKHRNGKKQSDRRTV